MKQRKPKKYECEQCHDKGFVRYKGGVVGPCDKCNPDGMPGGPDGDIED